MVIAAMKSLVVVLETLEKRPVRMMVVPMPSPLWLLMRSTNLYVPVIGIWVKTAINKVKSKTIGIMATVACK